MTPDAALAPILVQSPRHRSYAQAYQRGRDCEGKLVRKYNGSLKLPGSISDLSTTLFI